MSGLIGGLAGRALSARHDVSALGRTDVDGFPTTVADIADLAAIRPAFQGVDTVIHMAASRGKQSFDVHLNANVIGTYNVLEAARETGVGRVVLASSGAVMSGYERDEPFKSMVRGDPDVQTGEMRPMITTDMPVRPGSLYSVTKVWGEAIGRVYAEQHGMSVICVRIGKVEVTDIPQDARSAAVWCSQRDVVQIIEGAVDAPDSVRFEIVFAVSDNPTNYRDYSDAARALGYRPEDSAAQHGF